MAVSNAIQGQLGYAAESTFGTGVTPTRFTEFITESFKRDDERIEAKGIRTGTRLIRSDRYRIGRTTVEGGIETEIHNKGMGLLFRHMLGSVATTGPVSGAYDHTFTVGSLFGLSLTFEAAWVDTAAANFSKQIVGAKCKSWELSTKVGELMLLKTEWSARDLTAQSSLTTASYPSTTAPFVFTDAVLTLGGSSVDVTECVLKGTNAIDEDRHYLGSRLRKEQIENEYREITGELTTDWTAWTDYNRFINGTEASLVLTATGGLIGGAKSYQVIVTANVRTDGDTPEIGGRGRIAQPLKVKVADTGAGTPFSLLYITTDSTP